MIRFARRSAPPQPLALPRDEMAFRKKYQRLLLEKKITTVFRPGDRLYPAWRGYAPGEVVTARVIARVGSDALGVPPAFNRVRIPIRLDEVTVLDAAALEPADFQGSSFDVRDLPSLEAHIKAIYGRPLSAWGGLVTRIRFSYLAAA